LVPEKPARSGPKLDETNGWARPVRLCRRWSPASSLPRHRALHLGLEFQDLAVQQYPEAEWICSTANRRPTPWRELSVLVAYNPHIGTQGLVALLKTKILRLDLTACNVTPPGARRLGQTLDQLAYTASSSTSPLESLCLARNVYMGPGAFPLITAACHRLLRLDVSHCQLPVLRIWQCMACNYYLEEVMVYLDTPAWQLDF
jgi:hypothetical protein